MLRLCVGKTEEGVPVKNGEIRFAMRSCVWVMALLGHGADSMCIRGDCKDGHGTYDYDDKHSYEGEWKGGLKHGQGRQEYADGSSYEGEFDNDRFHGQGRWTYAHPSGEEDGGFYAGQWEDNKQHGKGLMMEGGEKGHAFTGVWKEGVMGDGKWQTKAEHLADGGSEREL
jgi:hypothetical protein